LHVVAAPPGANAVSELTSAPEANGDEAVVSSGVGQLATPPVVSRTHTPPSRVSAG